MLGYIQCFFKVTTLHFSELTQVLPKFDKHCMYTNPFNQRVSAFYRDNYACPLGGLKGKTAPGDAHPYLALF